MALLTYQNIKISGIAVCIPKKTIVNKKFGSNIFDSETLHKTIQTTGIEERHVVTPELCASDLCFHAAEKLIDDLKINEDSIEILIFVSQTPDYRIPATACLLQHRLGLPKTTAAFDINLGCSGFVYGLSVAFSYVANLQINKKILLLVGDTVSKFTSPADKSSNLLFGDAGSATIIESSENTTSSYFSLNTDGGGFEALHIKAGGYRNPSNYDSLSNQVLENGSIRNLEQLNMDGGEIFNFTIREIPKDINKLLDYAGLSIQEIDYIIFHQANKFMLEFLCKKLKFPLQKVPLSLAKYGNTSSVSIPLTIVSQLMYNLTKQQKNIVISGFGVGLSWGSAIISLDNCQLSNLHEI